MIKRVWITFSLPLPYPCVCLANELSTASTASFNTDLAGWDPSEPLGTFALFVRSSCVAAMLTIEKRRLYEKHGSLWTYRLHVFMLLLLHHNYVVRLATNCAWTHGDDNYEEAMKRLLSLPSTDHTQTSQAGYFQGVGVGLGLRPTHCKLGTPGIFCKGFIFFGRGLRGWKVWKCT